MRPVFRPTTLADQPRLAEFLSRHLGLGIGHPAVDAELMMWKYWRPRSDISAPRSYVLEREGCILSHAGLWPLRLVGQSQQWSGVHMIDWAADPAAPGAGVSLVRRLTQLVDFIVSFGGSAATQRVLPAFGFRTVGEMWTAARPIRPLRQCALTPALHWRYAARAVRNVTWSAFPQRAGYRECRPIKPDIYARSAQNAVTLSLHRPLGLCEYLLDCPCARFEYYSIGVDEDVAVCVSTAGHQIRLVDVSTSTGTFSS